ncbi:HNH endonuclease [Proteinivorax hydrogeniformans]|uniref:HNH endonuclease n=1 Tax=Proteinivorax hydrogeniformans TaxID=1826727 RepID=A0AAU8HSY0_9FIRM
MKNHKCIYCLQMKHEKDFNKEHVVPQMMGKYENGYVLSDFQVCQECNSYFSINVENIIALDSYEAFLRMQFRNTPMSDGRKLQGNRIRLIGDENIFKGVPFIVITDKDNPYRVRFESEPMVGIVNDVERQEYNYYTIDDLPEATEEVISKMKIAPSPIVNTGISKDDLDRVLIEKGYLKNSCYSYTEMSVADVFKEPDFTTKISFKIDSIMRRVCAKTVFNYLCYLNGKEFVLDSNFDNIRKYIRYGTWSEQLWFRYSKGPVSSVVMPNDTSHVVGYMWFPEDGQWILCGCLTWYGDLTYIFKLGETQKSLEKYNFLDSTKMACFNNVNRTIIVDDSVHVYGGRTSEIK